MQNNLIERYVQAVGRALPANRREDVTREIRSALYDEMEALGSDDSDVVAMLKRMGSPQQVAAAYYPAGSYLIGPALYPMFQLVLGIVFVAVIGAQLLAVVLAVALAGSPFAPLEVAGDLLASLPSALGMVVVVFWLLQRQAVDLTRENTFDPTRLPPVEQAALSVGRFGQLLSILLSVTFLTLLTQFALRGGFAWVDGTGLFENPVLQRNFPLVALALLAGIVVEIVLLWAGRWTVRTRALAIASNVFDLIVLAVLLTGHTAWLAEQGVSSVLTGLADLPALVETGKLALIQMSAMRMGLTVAAVVSAAEIVGHLVRIVNPGLTLPPDGSPKQAAAPKRLA